jgi:hypothetical protein
MTFQVLANRSFKVRDASRCSASNLTTIDFTEEALNLIEPT